MSSLSMLLHIPTDHPCYAGHFPDQAIVPGVMLLELVLQAAQNQTEWQWLSDQAFEMPVCKFLQTVLPGDALALTLSTGAHSDTCQFQLHRGHAPDVQLVASGALRCATPT